MTFPRRLPPILIDIDAIVRQRLTDTANGIFKAIGINPARAWCNAMVLAIFQEVENKRLSWEGFRRRCENLAILNPGLCHA